MPTHSSMLKQGLEALIDGTYDPAVHSPSRTMRRRSLERHEGGRCSRYFHHPAQFRDEGIEVPALVHTGHVVKTQSSLCIETLNDMIERRAIFSTGTECVHKVLFSVLRADRQTLASSISVYGRAPSTQPTRIRHAVVRQKTSHLGVNIDGLLTGKISSIPLYVTIDIGHFDKWELFENDVNMTDEFEIQRQDYPQIASLIAGRSAGGTLKVPHCGARSWMRYGGKKAGMALDLRYTHAIAVILTSHRTAVVVDSNRDRPDYVDESLRAWVESWGFEYTVAPLPDFNQEDSREIKTALQTLGIETPVTLGGYCASLTLAYIIDVLCTSQYDDGHFRRFLRDVTAHKATTELQRKVCIVLYARAVSNDCIRECLRRIRSNEIPLPTNWPSSIPTHSDFKTVRVRLRDALAACRT